MNRMDTENAIKSRKTSKSFLFSVIAAVLILINAVILGIVARWFIGIMPTLPGSSGNDPMLLYSLSAIGSVLGVAVLSGALMLQRKPLNRKVWGALIVTFSVPSVIMGGGFIVGFILGIIGGVLAFAGKSQVHVGQPKLQFLKLTDDSGMKLEGAGPRIMAPLFITFIVTALVSYIYQPTLNYPLPASWTFTAAVAFLAVGIPFWVIAVGMFLQAWNKGQLQTRGPFAVMPNPIYGSFILFIIPSISLLLDWWPILLTSAAMYAAQRVFIREEDEMLRKKFGKQYEEYRTRVLLKFL